ncbi:peptide-methionine (S)-S-oxide reductase MsrA [Flaviflexus equikiangi]|uniref:Peptide methionine sulfoxide reductase MsrA n=1 Tax=Flaviflexus equikiangi TaxID=2758573 RepID=A0ABS2TD71_9ACTO|nr:peptide-methionine (S)-S-oxide reductase MsrA [Flaviflexus equikiangi]MBM9432605.1 peptide-methionine (S)-S-oxide reductase MsrA [Flaviflexus equikiangi]
MGFLHFTTPSVTAETALSGRDTPVLPNPRPHTVLGTRIDAQPAEGHEEAYLALGCYWGAEKIFWELGAETTAVGFMGGYTKNPTYMEVCTGLTGHTETVRVVFDPATVSYAEILRAFFESHDPTTLNRQGNDRGTQYRSAIFATTAEQFETAKRVRDLYQDVLDTAGKGTIVTEIHEPGSVFYFAEDDHQQYLDKNPSGYNCHSRTGLPCPIAR